MSSETKIRARPAAVTLTPAAEARIAELMARAPAGAIGVKLSTPRRGCSGLAYSVDYVTEEAKFDEKIETPGGTFYIDGASVLYLVGLDRDRGEVRSFRLSRFRSDPVQEGEASAPPEGFDGREHLRVAPWAPPEDSIEASVLLSPGVAWWAVSSLTGARVERSRDDGWVEVALPIERGGGFTSWVLSFGSDVVVLSPPELRQDVVDRLESAAGKA